MKDLRSPKAFGAGLIALDLVMGPEPESPIRSWAGGTCGNVLSILSYLGWDAYPIARMNDDAASQRVRADMSRWGVHLDFTSCGPATHTPIIIQELRRSRSGTPTHRFSWSCPHCGQWLPGFKPITRAAVEPVEAALSGASVFFLDRLSRATITLASRASAEGALVVFEPSGKADDKLFAEALQISHVVKYAEQRISAAGDIIKKGNSALIEIQTLGENGLRYRHNLSGKPSEWIILDAIEAPRLADTCGSGDWCTAGFLTKAAIGGQEGLLDSGPEGLYSALRYGQALAAWNCGFEGARGGMYVVDAKTFSQEIEALLAGRTDFAPIDPVQIEDDELISCPACPPNTHFSTSIHNVT